jgi:hypothetical protein
MKHHNKAGSFFTVKVITVLLLFDAAASNGPTVGAKNYL